jgi:flagellar basal-body rod protein FlgG
LQVGHGSKAVAIQKMFSQGTLIQTYGALDWGVQGEGFFQISQIDGSTAYTRDGSFKLSADGKIVTADGATLEPNITIPADASEITMSPGGALSVRLAGQTDAQEIGQIELVRFINPAALTSIGNNLYKANSNTGESISGTPGLEGFGTLSQGNLEGSNVEVVEEMVNMIAAQRAYEINSKAIKTVHDMLAIANNLVR